MWYVAYVSVVSCGYKIFYHIFASIVLKTEGSKET